MSIKYEALFIICILVKVPVSFVVNNKEALAGVIKMSENFSHGIVSHSIVVCCLVSRVPLRKFS